VSKTHTFVEESFSVTSKELVSLDIAFLCADASNEPEPEHDFAHMAPEGNT
jgi:hypothetical protein